jgi:hypothetical protein
MTIDTGDLLAAILGDILPSTAATIIEGLHLATTAGRIPMAHLKHVGGAGLTTGRPPIATIARGTARRETIGDGRMGKMAGSGTSARE